MKDKTDGALERLNAAVEGLVTSEDWKKGLATLARFHDYSFGNVMLIASQNPRASRVAGFKKWEELGRHVKKGAKGLMILAPWPRKFTRTERDARTGAEREVSRQWMDFRPVYVFDVAQTDGEPLALPPAPVRLGENPADAAQILAGLTRVAKDLGFTVQWSPGVIEGDEGLNGYCAHDTKRIVVRSDMAGAQKIKTLAHEIAHAILHDAKNNSTAAAAPRSVKEVEAESTAFVVATHLGLDTSAYSIPYVAHWSKGDVKTVQKVGERVAKTARRIIEALETK